MVTHPAPKVSPLCALDATVPSVYPSPLPPAQTPPPPSAFANSLVKAKVSQLPVRASLRTPPLPGGSSCVGHQCGSSLRERPAALFLRVPRAQHRAWHAFGTADARGRTMILLLNPEEFRDSCQGEGACELSFGREVGQVNKAGRARRSREKSLEWSSHQSPRRQRAFCKQKEIQEAGARGTQESAAAR